MPLSGMSRLRCDWRLLTPGRPAWCRAGCIAQHCPMGVVHGCSQLGNCGPASSRLLCTACTAEHAFYNSVSRRFVQRIAPGCRLLECLCEGQRHAGVVARAHTLSSHAVAVCALCGACTRLVVPLFKHLGCMFWVPFLGLLPFIYHLCGQAVCSAGLLSLFPVG